jgi:hypothetical protein
MFRGKVDPGVPVDVGIPVHPVQDKYRRMLRIVIPGLDIEDRDGLAAFRMTEFKHARSRSEGSHCRHTGPEESKECFC